MNIILSNVSKSFGKKVVIQNFSSVIYQHQFNIIMGPSGCGKTTLLNILMGFLSPDRGTITGVPENKSAVFQEDRLCESFSAVSNVRMVSSKDIDTKVIIEHFRSIGITKNSIHLPVSQLSGGMRRRVAIVRAILAKSDILFLDEPFKGLDVEIKNVVIEYIKANTKSKTVVLVTHDVSCVNEFNGTLIKMDLLE